MNFNGWVSTQNSEQNQFDYIEFTGIALLAVFA